MALLLFDIDGTLINTKGAGKAAFNKAFEKFWGIKNAFDDVPFMGRTDKFIWKTACLKNNVPFSEYEKYESEILDSYYVFLKEEIEKRKKHIFVYPGIKEILNSLNSKHCFGLLTGNFKKSAYIKLNYFGLDKYFPVGGFADDSDDRIKIAKKAIKKSCEYYKKNFKKSEIYIIGDTPFDIECAKKTETVSVAVATGGVSYEELKKYSPDFLFKSFENYSEFIKIFEKNN